MPNNRRTNMKKIKGREAAHPGSRKAAQITRVHLRSAKLASAAKARKELTVGRLFRPTFFFHCLQGPEALTLEQLRALVSEVFIARNDERLAELSAERRPGRPKAKELLELEELKRVEEAEWETGFEVIDLTNPACTRLMWSWGESKLRLKPAHVDLLPHVRVFRAQPDVKIESRPSKIDKMGLGGEAAVAIEAEGEDEEDEAMEA